MSVAGVFVCSLTGYYRFSALDQLLVPAYRPTKLKKGEQWFPYMEDALISIHYGVSTVEIL